MSKRIKTNYPGIYYREAKRIGGNGAEKVYYIVFKKDGKVYEEKIGRQYADNITPAKASRIRAERIEGRRQSRKEMRKAQEAAKLAKLNRWTINSLWEEYRAVNPQLKGIVQDESRFTNYIKPNWGKNEPKELTPTDIDRFRVKLLKTKKAGTVKNILELLRRIIMFGVKKNLSEGPGFIIEMPKVNNQKTEDLTPEQLGRLLTTLEEEKNIQAANLMRLVLFTGMRRGELFRLQWDDIDFNRSLINIRDPKGGVDQKIPLNNAAHDLLENHPRTKSKCVFPGHNGKQRNYIIKPVNRIKERAGLPKDFRPLHGLRHVFASMIASSGKVDMYTLQKLLTHKSQQMTQRYAHLRDDVLKKASNLAGNIIENIIEKNANRK